MRTQAYLGNEQGAAGEVKPNAASAGRLRKDTIVARRVVPPDEAPAPPRAPSITAQQIDTGKLPPSAAEGAAAAPAADRPALDLTPTEANQVSSKLSEAIAAARAGRGAEAVTLLRQLTQEEPENDLALLWLARTTSSIWGVSRVARTSPSPTSGPLA